MQEQVVIWLVGLVGLGFVGGAAAWGQLILRQIYELNRRLGELTKEFGESEVVKGERFARLEAAQAHTAELLEEVHRCVQNCIGESGCRQ